MHERAQGIEMVMTAPASTKQAANDDRWPRPLAALFILGLSLTLWGGIYAVIRFVLG